MKTLDWIADRGSKILAI
jgi:hypothetical protein